jgi:hypothetical protein
MIVARRSFFRSRDHRYLPARQPGKIIRVESPAYGIGVIGYAIDGPLAAAVGPSAVFGVGAVYGLLSSAAVLALRSVRSVRWHDQDGEPVPPRQAEPGPRG